MSQNGKRFVTEHISTFSLQVETLILLSCLPLSDILNVLGCLNLTQAQHLQTPATDRHTDTPRELTCVTPNLAGDILKRLRCFVSIAVFVECPLHDFLINFAQNMKQEVVVT